MPDSSRIPTLFLLSPADISGTRARQLMSPKAMFASAIAYRSADGVAISEAFTFMSALYFRGKITYARRFASALAEGDPAVFVIAPGFGLVIPDWRLTPERVSRLRRVKVDPRRPSYRKPLELHALDLAGRLGGRARVVLLGSIATGKYVDVLRPIFGDDLLFPVEFAGMGDMSRGALLLRAATSGIELEYGTLDSARHAKRPPRELTTSPIP